MKFKSEKPEDDKIQRQWRCDRYFIIEMKDPHIVQLWYKHPTASPPWDQRFYPEFLVASNTDAERVIKSLMMRLEPLPDHPFFFKAIAALNAVARYYGGNAVDHVRSIRVGFTQEPVARPDTRSDPSVHQ